MYKLLAVIIGGIISLMITFNGQLQGSVGATYSLIIIHLVGLTIISIILLVKKEKIKIEEKVPKYLFLGGVIGVALTLVNMITIVSIGVTLTTSLGVFGQLTFSSAIDHFGLLGMDKYKFNNKKIVGFIIIAIGLVIMTV